jgi:hypothetical protein
MVMLIVLVVAVAGGVLSTGSQNGDPSGQAPPPSLTPTANVPTTPSSTSVSPDDAPDDPSGPASPPSLTPTANVPTPPTSTSVSPDDPSQSVQPTSEPTPSESPSAFEPTVDDLVGSWVAADGSSLTFSSTQTFQATRDGELVDSGSVIQAGSGFLLLSDAGSDGSMRLDSPDSAFVSLPSIGPVRRFVRA